MQFRRCSINGVKYEEVGGLLCECSPLGAQPSPVAVFSVSNVDGNVIERSQSNHLSPIQKLCSV